jgi:hypothetical protein
VRLLWCFYKVQSTIEQTSFKCPRALLGLRAFALLFVLVSHEFFISCAYSLHGGIDSENGNQDAARHACKV